VFAGGWSACVIVRVISSASVSVSVCGRGSVWLGARAGVFTCVRKTVRVCTCVCSRVCLREYLSVCVCTKHENRERVGELLESLLGVGGGRGQRHGGGQGDAGKSRV